MFVQALLSLVNKSGIPRLWIEETQSDQPGAAEAELDDDDDDEDEQTQVFSYIVFFHFSTGILFYNSSFCDFCGVCCSARVQSFACQPAAGVNPLVPASSWCTGMASNRCLLCRRREEQH